MEYVGKEQWSDPREDGPRYQLLNESQRLLANAREWRRIARTAKYPTEVKIQAGNWVRHIQRDMAEWRRLQILSRARRG